MRSKQQLELTSEDERDDAFEAEREAAWQAEVSAVTTPAMVQGAGSVF